MNPCGARFFRLKRSPGLGLFLWAWRGLFLGLILTESVLSVVACRYSVRDVGFVDLADEPYRLCLSKQADEGQALADSLERVGGVVLNDSNVRWQWDGFPEGVTDHGVACLVSSSAGILPLTYPSGKSPDDIAWKFFEQVVVSPKRNLIKERLAEAFCVLLLVSGSPGNGDRDTRSDIQGSIQSISDILPHMPKPVDAAPELIEIGATEVREEEILLWSLGFDLSEEREDQIAVLYGRGRRIGPVLSGGMITQTRLTEIMTIVGQDCECELDRAWMKGPNFPGVFGPSWQSVVYDHLGFDTENPMIKTEISRILSRGPNPQMAAERPPETFERYQLGYVEEAVQENGSELNPADLMDLDRLLSDAKKAIESASAPSVDSLSSDVLDSAGVSPPNTNPTRKEKETPAQQGKEGGFRLSLWVFFGILAASLGGGGWVLLQANKNA